MSYIQNKLDEELKKLTFWDKITIAEQESLRFFCLAMNKDYHNHIVEKIGNEVKQQTIDDILFNILWKNNKKFLKTFTEASEEKYFDNFKDKILSLLQDTNPKE